MASNPVQITTGTEIDFATSLWAAENLEINPSPLSRKSIPTSHLGTAAPGATHLNNATSIPGGIITAGPVEIAGHFNPDTVPPIDEAPEVIEITYKDGAKDTFTGYMTEFNTTSPFDDKMGFNASIMPSGVIERTAAP